ncbi:hypothetical protein BU26DRAFT_266877 [Trematosphaeria pertusa]|uniref:F-box domain-containing protein n=1 Tax=Trematosphaeria pertusa TaxID=390896 RepID=A0A6A6IJ65_9PLEO|nr:uncharacterized protein BU26DRAFT_266877 [Trematosphaeria pertusa]KAF2250614.1 hypothetical protein BU26DRAFT_266877 [Trematosphaeria pertusa]
MAANDRREAVASRSRSSTPSLPPEIWANVVRHVSDDCFAWFVLRRVCRFLRHITEDVFSRYVLHNLTVRFAGEHARRILFDVWDWNEYGVDNGGGDIGYWPWERVSPLQEQFATFPFKSFTFSPADTKDRVILTLRDQSIDYEAGTNDDYFVRGDWTRECTYTRTFYLRRQCCTCDTRIETTDEVARCDCLASLFFNPSSADDLKRLINESHFVLLNDQLRSIPIPSIAVNEQTRAISLDWRRLCQSFYLNELQCRRAAAPWLRYVSMDDASGDVRVHEDEDGYHHASFEGWRTQPFLEFLGREGWLFWDQAPTGPYRRLRTRDGRVTAMDPDVLRRTA